MLPLTRAAPLDRREGWRLHLSALAVLVVALLALFHADAAAIVGMWIESSTFNHCLLIVPILGWLVWQRLPELRQLAPQAWAPGLLLVAAGAFGWLLGASGGVALARQAGLVLMLEGAVITCLGKAVARGIAFPLFFALFLIPTGEEIVPLMQTVTAHMCMVLLAAIGISAHLDGVFITTPAGVFEVAEACSGVKFLVAMVAYGALVANLCFRSWPRRIAFMAAAIVIPILANGVRAFATIFAASLTSIEFATGFDHIVYGWIFFGIVIALLMAAGWRFFDRPAGAPWFDPAALQSPGTEAGPRRSIIVAAAAVLGIAALPLIWSQALAAAGTTPLPARVELPSPQGWQRIPASHGRAWQPNFAGADRLSIAHYRNDAGEEVELAIAIFTRQRESAEVVGYGQGPVGPDSHWAWTANGPAPSNGRLDRIASFGTVREVATFYRVGSTVTGSPLGVKIETMKTRLLGGPQGAVAVLVSAQAPAEGISPRPAIDAFIAALGPIDRLADTASGRE
jgi:exosortase A